MRIPALGRRAGLAAAGDGAEPMKTFSAEYSVSFFGLTVARSTVVSRFGPDRYAIDGTIESAGLASFFDSTKGTTSATGKIGQAGVRPDSYSVDYVYGKKTKKTACASPRAMSSRSATCRRCRTRAPDWVPVAPKDLRPCRSDQRDAHRGASDAAFGLRSHDEGVRRRDPRRPGAELCQHGPVSIGGDQRSRWSPARAVSSRSRAISRATSRSNICRPKASIMLKFAQLGKTGIYAPIQATVGTKVGTFTIRARRLEAVQ